MDSQDAAVRIQTAVGTIVALAERLPSGDVEHHVKASAHELEGACSRGEGVHEALDRFTTSIRQLQTELAVGARRHEQQDTPAIERLLEGLQVQLLAGLRRQNLL